MSVAVDHHSTDASLEPPCRLVRLRNRQPTLAEWRRRRDARDRHRAWLAANQDYLRQLDQRREERRSVVKGLEYATTDGCLGAVNALIRRLDVAMCFEYAVGLVREVKTFKQAASMPRGSAAAMAAEAKALRGVFGPLVRLRNEPPTCLAPGHLDEVLALSRRALALVRYRLGQLASEQAAAGRAARSVQARLDAFAAAPGEVESPAAPVQAGAVEAQAPPPAAPETRQAATPSPTQPGAPGPPIEVVPGGGAAPPGIEEHMGRLAAAAVETPSAPSAAAQAPTGPHVHLAHVDTLTAGSIHKRGAVWEVRYGVEQGSYPTKDFSAFAPVAKLLARPHHLFRLKELVVGDERALLERSDSQGDLLDETALGKLQSRLAELREDREKNADDPLVLKEIDEKTAAIAAEVKAAQGPSGRKRNLGSTAESRAWDALTRGLRRLWPRLHKAGMPALADHLDKVIHFDRPQIAYRPPANTPPWVIEA
jgi:hypothetical protein